MFAPRFHNTQTHVSYLYNKPWVVSPTPSIEKFSGSCRTVEFETPSQVLEKCFCVYSWTTKGVEWAWLKRGIVLVLCWEGNRSVGKPLYLLNALPDGSFGDEQNVATFSTSPILLLYVCFACKNFPLCVEIPFNFCFKMNKQKCMERSAIPMRIRS